MKIEERNGTMHLGRFSFAEIAAEYGTPFYLYDLDAIKKKICRVKEAFGQRVELYYAVKANSNLEILKGIRHDLDGLDISSAGELAQSLLAGYTPGSLSFAGPGKTRDELREAIQQQVGIISVESLRELRDIKELAAITGRKVDIAIRVNPRLLIKEFAIKMGGKATQFGIDEEDVGTAFEYLSRHEEAFNLQGIHIYAGTQCMNEAAIIKNITNTLEIAAGLRENYGFECSWINLGGGFGVSYDEENREIDLDTLGVKIGEAFDHYVASTGSKPRFILELGRYLVAEAGIYVTRVVSEKQSRGEKYYVLDGGMNHHLAASGNLGTIIRKNYLARNLSQPASPQESCNLVGPLCTPLDLMGKNVSIPSPGIGDLIGILNSGSYAYTASPLLFLGHETPAELMVEDNEIRVIRNRRLLTDFN